MSDAEASQVPEAPQTRLFNRTTQPRVLLWGSGVVMPGESFLTDHPESFAPDQPNSPWTVDAEAAGALPRVLPSNVTSPSGSAPDGPSGPQVSPQGANPVPPPVAETVLVEPDGEIRNQAGEVVGFVNNPAAQAAANTQE